MIFFIDKALFTKYPQLMIGVVIGRDINLKNQKKLDLFFESVVSESEQLLQGKKVSDLEAVKSWRSAYKAFGADPHKFSPSVEQLLKRASQRKLPRVNALVDFYNLMSVKHSIPAGANDIDTLQGDISLRYATDHESPVTLIGAHEEIIPSKGEVIYADSKSTICSRWNWKQDDRTKVTENSKNVIFFFDALPPTTGSQLRSILTDFIDIFSGIFDGEISFSVLSNKHSSVTIPQKGTLLEFDEGNLFEPQQQVEEPVVGQEYEVRKGKVEKLKEQGISSWPEHVDPVPDTAARVITEFASMEGKKIYSLAGRLRAIRKHGKSIFATVQDHTGFVQIYIKKDQLSEAEFSLFDTYCDIGDIIGVTGTSFKTKMGEITVLVTKLSLFSKSLRSLPEKFHGLTDTETKYRQRYLDLICNDDSRERFKKRSKIVQCLRSIFDEHGYIEVETPMLHPLYGGAAAKPFVTHHNALHADLYLRIAPELYLKRLVVGGFNRVYEINRNFRNEGISTRHNPEFTMLEFYTAYVDYETIMNFTEGLLRQVVKEVCGGTTITFNEHKLDFSSPFRKITMLDSVAFKTDRSTHDLMKRDVLFDIAREHDITYSEQFSWGAMLALLFEHFVEKQLIQPTFVTQFPTDISPLAKKNAHNHLFTDRFELFVAGMELGNGFNELNDPFDQAARFKEQLASHGDSDEKHLFDADYIQALEYGLPPTSGVGIGIDRLVMFLTNAPSIRDVVLFPTLKKK